jgi:hypothetical protein
MTDNDSHILFNKSILQLRHIGRLGGKAFGRNLRARRAMVPPPPEAIPFCARPLQSVAEAVAILDAQFPWLRRAEQRRSPGTACTPAVRSPHNANKPGMRLPGGLAP